MVDFNKIKQYYMNFPDKSGFVPRLDEDGELVLCYSDSEGYSRARYLAFSLGISSKYEEAGREKIFELIENLGGDMDDIGGGNDEDELESDVSNILVSSHDDAPIIKLVNQIIINAVRAGASDIHFEGREGAFLVRFRVDGKLNTVKRYPVSVHDPLIARIKVISSLDVSETRRSQDGRINLKVGNRLVDLRVSTVPAVSGEKVVLRILERSKDLVNLEHTGMPEEILTVFRPYLSRTSGIILVTGPTGSGKSTTLYASLLAMDREDKNVVTIEDPVEYHIDNVTQVQVNSAVDLSFASAVRSFMRQDPDIMLIGEIRDEETAETAIQSSLTGHLVLSTLHTNNAPTAVARLIEMDVEPFLLASSLLVVLGQRLVRKVCSECSSVVEPDPVLKKTFKDAGCDLGSYRKGAGCEVCLDTGYKGRIGVFEVLEVDDEVRRCITHKRSSQEIGDIARKSGYKNMLENGMDLIKAGVTTPEELLSIARTE